MTANLWVSFTLARLCLCAGLRALSGRRHACGSIAQLRGVARCIRTTLNGWKPCRTMGLYCHYVRAWRAGQKWQIGELRRAWRAPLRHEAAHPFAGTSVPGGSLDLSVPAARGKIHCPLYAVLQGMTQAPRQRHGYSLGGQPTPRQHAPYGALEPRARGHA